MVLVQMLPTFGKVLLKIVQVIRKLRYIYSELHYTRKNIYNHIKPGPLSLSTTLINYCILSPKLTKLTQTHFLVLI